MEHHRNTIQTKHMGGIRGKESERKKSVARNCNKDYLVAVAEAHFLFAHKLYFVYWLDYGGSHSV